MSQRILIAEDDELQSAVLQQALVHRGHDVEIVTNGLEAVRRLRTGQYDIGLLDYNMPEINGLAAARLLHDFFCEAECPRLIAITAAAEEVVAKGQTPEGRGFDAVVSKRLGLPAMLAVIDGQLASLAAGKIAAAAVLERGRPSVAHVRSRNPWLRVNGAVLSTPGPGKSTSEAEKAPARPGDKTAPLSEDPFAAPPRSDGQVQAISLAAFKAALGPEWPRAALRAMSKAEQIIKRRLLAGDVLSRSGDHSFVIWFNSTDLRNNEAVLAAAAREIRMRLLTDFGEDMAPAVCTSSAAVRQFLPAHDEGAR